MRGLVVLAGLAALGLAGAAGAQDGAGDRTATVAAGAEGGVEVVIGTTSYMLPASEPFLVCIDGRADTLEGSTLVVRPFARTAGDGWLAFPSFVADASGSISGARSAECFRLDPEPVTP